MVWKTHRSVTFVTALALTRDPVAAALAAMGSTFPDMVEGPFWKCCHRTYSHWFVLYLPVLVFLWPGSIHTEVLAQDMVRTGLFWFFFGAFLHIVEDAFCGKVPLLRPTQRVQVFPRLFYTGSMREYIVAGAYCLAVLGLMAVRR